MQRAFSRNSLTQQYRLPTGIFFSLFCESGKLPEAERWLQWSFSTNPCPAQNAGLSEIGVKSWTHSRRIYPHLYMAEFLSRKDEKSGGQGPVYSLCSFQTTSLHSGVKPLLHWGSEHSADLPLPLTSVLLSPDLPPFLRTFGTWLKSSFWL